MRRFLLLYIRCDDQLRHYAEGLIHFARAVYVRDFCEDGVLFTDMQALKNSLRDDDDIVFFFLQEIDPVQL